MRIRPCARVPSWHAPRRRQRATSQVGRRRLPAGCRLFLACRLRASRAVPPGHMAARSCCLHREEPLKRNERKCRCRFDLTNSLHLCPRLWCFNIQRSTHDLVWLLTTPGVVIFFYFNNFNVSFLWGCGASVVIIGHAVWSINCDCEPA